MASTTIKQETITIQTATISDIPTLSKIQLAAYRSDLVSHIMTLDRPDDWSYSAWLERMNAFSFQDPDVTAIKAVDISANRIVGWACWALKGPIVQEVSGDIETPSSAQSGDSNGKITAAPSTTPKSAGEVAAAAATETIAPCAALPPEPQLPRQVLSSLIGADSTTQYAKYMSFPLSRFVSSDGRHLVLEGLFVHPEFQKRGIGSALLEQCLHAADSGVHGDVTSEEGKPARDEEPLSWWVHASPSSWRLYERMGFKEVERLEVDLGAVMRGRKSDGEGGERGGGSGWGVYVFRYMVREGRGKESVKLG